MNQQSTYKIPPANEPIRQPAVEISLQELEKTVVRLKEQWEKLSHKLTPVLSPWSPPQKQPEITESSVPVVARLDVIQRDLSWLASNINDYSDHIEI